jgi:hypothetical protein
MNCNNFRIRKTATFFSVLFGTMVMLGMASSRAQAAGIVTVTANPNPVAYGGTTTVSWSATGNPTFCNETGGRGGTGATGSFSVTLTTTTTFTVVCSWPDNIILDISATPNALPPGQATNIKWQSNAAACTGVNFSTGVGDPPSGNTTVIFDPPLPITYVTYTAHCMDSSGSSVNQSVTVNATTNRKPVYQEH